MARITDYQHFGGRQSETAAFTNIIRAQGERAPHNGKPYSEALILGISGGLGAGYILWEFKEHNAKILVFGWQNHWQYPIQFYETLCKRLNLTPTFHETGSQKAAAQQLEDSLAEDKAVIAWVDRAQMPYLHLPKALEGHLGHYVSIYGIEDGDVLVDDLAAKPFRVPAETMASARGRIGSYKNRLLSVEANGAVDLPEAIQGGLQACVEHLSQPSDSFSLPTFRKWGKMMTHRKNAKGWPVVFADRRGLFGALRSVYEGIELISTGGGGMRGLYADFLDEAAGIINRPALREVAKQYRSLAGQWSAFASSAMPDQVEPLRETKNLLCQRYNILMAEGGDAEAKTLPLTEQINALHVQYNREFPMSNAEIDALFETLGDGLLALYDAEVAALESLREVSVN
jgi:hypothetical protein